jgi:RND family efflux transporter MFP subunit
MPKLSKKTYIATAVVLVVLVGGYIHNQNKKNIPESVLVGKKTITQEVSVTGTVKSAEDLMLAFERSGKVAAVYAKPGDVVKKGKLLAVLANGDSFAQLQQSQAALDAALARLEEMEIGTRPENLAIYQEKVASAEQALINAQTSLENVKNKAAADTSLDSASALVNADSAITTGINALSTISDIQLAHFTAVGAQDEIKIADAKSNAVFYLLGQTNAGRWIKEFLTPLNGGAKETVTTAQQNPTSANIDIALSQTKTALLAVKSALEAVPLASSLTTTETTSLATDKTAINAQILTITNAQQTILVQNSYNNSLITTAATTVNSTQSALALTQLDLKLAQAGYTKQQIAAQEATVKQARAAVTNSYALLAKTAITAPISGTIAKIDAKAGEIINANAPAISIISENDFQIKANITEIDVAKISIGDRANVTLDAYGNDAVFDVIVTAIDPGETIIEGVPTYKTTLQFTKEDERIKSGMTANVNILTETRESVLAIPQKYAHTKNGATTVNVLENGATKPATIKLGLKSADGWVEILEGLNEGEKITY